MNADEFIPCLHSPWCEKTAGHEAECRGPGEPDWVGELAAERDSLRNRLAGLDGVLDVVVKDADDQMRLRERSQNAMATLLDAVRQSGARIPSHVMEQAAESLKVERRIKTERGPNIALLEMARKAEAALATARDQALEQAANVCDVEAGACRERRAANMDSGRSDVDRHNRSAEAAFCQAAEIIRSLRSQPSGGETGE